MNPIYDDIGINYSVNRCTDPNVAAQFYPELEGASRIINIGAGTGSYEPANFDLWAVEPSMEMINQRAKDAYPVKQGTAEKLPFEDNSFSHAMTILSMHHWPDKPLGFSEVNRVATDKFIAISWDPESEPFWLTRDYFPEIHEMDVAIFPKRAQFYEHFDNVELRPLQIPHDCQDGFFASFWKRPRAYLNPEVRQSTSPFSKITNLDKGLHQLESDLASGAWKEKNQELLNLSSTDCGYILITADTRKS